MTPGAAPPLDEVAGALRAAFGLSLSSGLEPVLGDALAAAASAAGTSPGALARRVLAGDAAALDALVERAVVPETSFWRHPDQLSALSALAFDARAPLEIWSAGCASGEEPYSVAMALLSAGRAGRGDRILATDVSDRLLAIARRGVYGARALRRLPEALAAAHLEPAAPGTAERRVSADVRALVALRRHNLVAEPAPGRFDVVLCRNVLIYFEPAAAARVVEGLVEALRPGGLLVLGPVEVALSLPLPVERVGAPGATLLRRPGPPRAC